MPLRIRASIRAPLSCANAVLANNAPASSAIHLDFRLGMMGTLRLEFREESHPKCRAFVTNAWRARDKAANTPHSASYTPENPRERVKIPEKTVAASRTI